MIDLGQLDEARIRLICEQKWKESDSLDFKRSLPGNDNKGRHELLKDVCAFANAGGGTLLYGIAEENAAAKEPHPITAEGDDAAILRLAQMLDAGIEPRIRGLAFEAVGIDGGYVLALKVPASFDGPHRFKVNEAARFVMRSGRYIVDLTYQQLRTAFGQTATLLDRARSFREERLSLIPHRVALPLPPKPGPLVVVHLIPMEAMAGSRSIDIRPFYYDYSPLQLPEWMNPGRHLNLDGVVVHVSSEKATITYTHLFRSGAMEAVRFAGLLTKPETRISGLVVARFIRDAISTLGSVADKAGLSGPAIVGIALRQVGEYSFLTDEHSEAQPPDRDDLIFPETWVDDLGEIEVDEIAKPVLDHLWQAYGEPVCSYYTAGMWTGKK